MESSKYKCNKTIGNYNSLIGFPLSFLASKIDSKYNILEYGASRPYEIKKLGNYSVELIKSSDYRAYAIARKIKKCGNR